MAKRFGKYIIKKDKRGFNRYYNKDGKRIKSSTFENYQRQFLRKARKAGFKAQQNILRYKPKDAKKAATTGEGGKPLPKRLQRLFKESARRAGYTPKQYQRFQINQWDDKTFSKMVEFIQKKGHSSLTDHVDINRLYDDINVFSNLKKPVSFMGENLAPSILKAKIKAINIKLIEALAKKDEDAKVYDHLFPVSYTDLGAGLNVTGEGKLLTDMGTFDGENFTQYKS